MLNSWPYYVNSNTNTSGYYNKEQQLQGLIQILDQKLQHTEVELTNQIAATEKANILVNFLIEAYVNDVLFFANKRLSEVMPLACSGCKYYQDGCNKQLITERDLEHCADAFREFIKLKDPYSL